MSSRWNRRSFLRSHGFLTLAGLTGALTGLAGRARAAVGGSAEQPGGVPGDARGAAGVAPGQAEGPEQRLRELGLELPPAPEPVAVYVTWVRTGDLLFTSGHGPDTARGKVGADLTLEEGHAAARDTGLRILSTVRNALGSLDRVSRLVKVTGMVNCTTDFTRQPEVVNGFSELMVEVFGDEAGKGARSAVGMGSLPSDIPVEIEAVFEVQ